ncbi:hypothetical protein CRG98_008556 [Punica granatum]|uniref:Uncharacterized protein n=1 Tax=Punica granatum TaxID=22663 RepID=A0A2I0KR42_PUNGR|nr:hypothetical protein CRG98_008556 [Punica granatum]
MPEDTRMRSGKISLRTVGMPASRVETIEAVLNRSTHELLASMKILHKETIRVKLKKRNSFLSLASRLCSFPSLLCCCPYHLRFREFPDSHGHWYGGFQPELSQGFPREELERVRLSTSSKPLHRGVSSHGRRGGTGVRQCSS